MHPYSIDSGERFRVTTAIVLLGIGLAYLIHIIQDLVGLSWPWWFDAPAAVGCATVLYNAFDQWAWRLGFWHKAGFISTPDFSGRWVGSGYSSHDGHQGKFDAEMHIRQRWTAIRITLQTAGSRSESQIAAVTFSDGMQPELCHTYTNRPRSGTIDSMNIHTGTATLRLVGNDSIDGEYYTGRGRVTQGTLSFQRQAE